MTICLTINADTPEMLQRFVKGLASGMGTAVLEAAAIAPEVPATAATFAPTEQAIGVGKGRKKAPAANAIVDQLPANDSQPDVAMLTVEDVRERSRKFAADGHMDEIAKAMEFYGVKKMSDIDPEALGKPSVKFAQYVAKIEELIAAKVA